VRSTNLLTYLYSAVAIVRYVDVGWSLVRVLYGCHSLTAYVVVLILQSYSCVKCRSIPVRKDSFLTNFGRSVNGACRWMRAFVVWNVLQVGPSDNCVNVLLASVRLC